MRPAAPPPRLGGAVLAGGHGVRFGGDKLLAEVDGRPLLAAAASVLATCCAPVVVVGRARPAGMAGAAPVDAWLPDAVPTGTVAADAGTARTQRPATGPGGLHGPLAGILAALEAATTPLVAVVAGDLPHPDPAVLTDLAARWGGEPAVLPAWQGEVQPLHGVWSAAHAARVREAFDAGGRSPRRLAVALGAQIVELAPGGAAASPPWLADVDTVADLARLRAADPAPRTDPKGPSL